MSRRLWPSKASNMHGIYIVYDSENTVWDKAYKTFEEARIYVQKIINDINENYMKSPHFIIGSGLPAHMELNCDKMYVKLGVEVANMYDDGVIIFIKEVSF